jgi:beta-glucosidase
VCFTGTTILEGIEKTVNSKTKVVYKAAPKKGDAKNKGYEYAIIVVGEQPYAEFDGDNQNLTLPDPYPELIQDTCAHVACVVVMVSGRPLVVEPFEDYMDAFVAAWLPGTEGDGIADVLFGQYDFQGKLSRTWFKRVDQLPMNVGDQRYDPLYPFGFGLKMGLRS